MTGGRAVLCRGSCWGHCSKECGLFLLGMQRCPQRQPRWCCGQFTHIPENRASLWITQNHVTLSHAPLLTYTCWLVSLPPFSVQWGMQPPEKEGNSLIVTLWFQCWSLIFLKSCSPSRSSSRASCCVKPWDPYSPNTVCMDFVSWAPTAIACWCSYMTLYNKEHFSAGFGLCHICIQWTSLNSIL